MLQLTAKPVVEKTKALLKFRVYEFTQKHSRPPKLSVILVGENPASQIYVGQKGKTAIELGMAHETLRFPATATPAEVRETVEKLNRDPHVDGILIQRPLPASFKEEELVYWVSPEKDVDAFHPENRGRLALGLPCLLPCTPAGVMLMLQHYEIPVAGKVACVIGRSSIVGKPMAQLLLQANATLIHCHSRTPNLKELSRQADLLVVAVGKAKVIDGSYVKPGAVVVDVGINRLPDGKLAGDVDFEDVAKKASALTPVPGGVGPMTILMLMNNTLAAAEQRSGKST